MSRSYSALCLVAVAVCLIGWARFLSWDTSVSDMRVMEVSSASGESLDLGASQVSIEDGEILYQIRESKGSSPPHLVRYNLNRKQAISLGSLEDFETLRAVATTGNRLLLLYSDEEDELWSAVITEDRLKVFYTGVLVPSAPLSLGWVSGALEFSFPTSRRVRRVVRVSADGTTTRTIQADSDDSYFAFVFDNQWWVQFGDDRMVSEAGAIRRREWRLEQWLRSLRCHRRIVLECGIAPLSPDLDIELYRADSAPNRFFQMTNDDDHGIAASHLGALFESPLWPTTGVERFVSQDVPWERRRGGPTEREFRIHRTLLGPETVHYEIARGAGPAASTILLRKWTPRSNAMVVMNVAGQLLLIGQYGEYVALSPSSLHRVDPLPWQDLVVLAGRGELFGLQADLLYWILFGLPILLSRRVVLYLRYLRARRRRQDGPSRVRVAPSVVEATNKRLAWDILIYLVVADPGLFYLWPLLQ